MSVWAIDDVSIAKVKGSASFLYTWGTIGLTFGITYCYGFSTGLAGSASISAEPMDDVSISKWVCSGYFVTNTFCFPENSGFFGGSCFWVDTTCLGCMASTSSSFETSILY